MNIWYVTSPEGHQIAVELPIGVLFGNPDSTKAAAKCIAAGLESAYATYPPQANA